MGNMVIDFAADGSAQALHSDKFPLSFLGAMHIERASEIKFDIGSQSWTIFLPQGEGEFVCIDQARGFHTYEEARQMEVEWLDACRLHGIAPMSDEGRAMLIVLRTPVTSPTSD